ncbi:MAG: zinc ribbon domain-containing protein YjdM [Bdellovibrionia bacterium]
METPNHCPKCQSENIYQDMSLWICPECGHEWDPAIQVASDEVLGSEVIKDAFGNELKDGDSVTVIKELRIKGSSSAVKVGTKVKNIRLTDGGDGHNIACKIDGLGSINLKSEFVKKA